MLVMLTAGDAGRIAADELIRDSDSLGAEIVAGPRLETPGLWAHHPDRARFFTSGRSQDSVSRG